LSSWATTKQIVVGAHGNGRMFADEANIKKKWLER
jgi:hypothetical protein